MKRKYVVILSFLCLCLIFFLSGLLFYSFKIQNRSDNKKQQSVSNAENADNIPEITPNTADVSKAGSPPEPSSPDKNQSGTAQDNPAPVPSGMEASSKDETEPESDALKPIVLAFAGDVNLDEASKPAAKYDAMNQNILDCLSKELIEEMNAADLMMLNNEFAYSTRGTKTPNKSYTFRADPERVAILKEMGVDIVSLANNHTLDYGQDALKDTFETLDGAGIDYVGAGENLDRAKAPIYRTIGDKTIAFVAASRVVFAMDWYASDTSPGMVGTYDPAMILESVKEAKENSDFVVIFVHWGVERNNFPEKYQRTLAKQYIDAGADAVIGCHPHVMQGFEFYKGKPIAYSLGNYWFNASAKESGLLKLYLNSDGSVKTQILPVMGRDTYTYLLTEEKERNDYYKLMEGLSYHAAIDTEGYITESE